MAKCYEETKENLGLNKPQKEHPRLKLLKLIQGMEAGYVELAKALQSPNLDRTIDDLNLVLKEAHDEAQRVVV